MVLVALWGVAGVFAVLVNAIWRLAPIALEPLRTHELSLAQWIVYVLWCLFNGYAEGYRGFQRSFVPRVVARAFYLGNNPQPLSVLLAPLFSMGLFQATRRRWLASWGLLLGVLFLVRLVRGLAQPWRGIIDGGVVVGLLYGSIALLWELWRVLKGAPITTDPQVPHEKDPATSADP